MDYGWGAYVIAFVVATICAAICANLAASRGHAPLLFAILGFFFFIPTLLILLFFPRLSVRAYGFYQDLENMLFSGCGPNRVGWVLKLLQQCFCLLFLQPHCFCARDFQL